MKTRHINGCVKTEAKIFLLYLILLLLDNHSRTLNVSPTDCKSHTTEYWHEVVAVENECGTIVKYGSSKV